MFRWWLSVAIGCVSSQCYSQQAEENEILPFNSVADYSFSDDATWEEKSVLGEELPMVLTAARLKQPKAEVPASVTVITSEQIKLWGVRTLPEVMKFVPGMLVGHGDDVNNTSVAYHTSNPSTMRRLQVLVDGRSVYKSAIATVIWDDVGLAIEDIDRIEVTRGPSASLYGANSYLGIINILTKHPEDSQGTLVSWRKGNKGIQDVHFRHALVVDSTSFKISGSVKADEGFDGRDSKGRDDLRDGRKHGFINAYINHQIDGNNSLDFQMGYKSGKTEIRQSDFDQDFPDKTSTNGYVYGKWQKEFSIDHQSHLQAYWQKDEKKQSNTVCLPTLMLDNEMAQLHFQNPEWANILASATTVFSDPEVQAFVAGLQAGVVTPELAMAVAKDKADKDVIVTQIDLDGTKNILGNVPNLSSDFSEISCGESDFDLLEQRFDIEWQDTVRWGERLRTVSGLSFRQDSAYSQTYFNGTVNNDTWRAFVNGEYRAADWLILNAGGMYEFETKNEDSFSPKLAANFILDNQQSIRLVASQAVRSPDLLEIEPEYIARVSNLSSNYLGDSTANFYKQVIAGENEASLKSEKITSYEVGYFVVGDFRGVKTEFDLKIFREEMRDMISEPISLDATDISNNNEADIKGFEFQLLSRLNYQHSLMATYAYTSIDSRYVGNKYVGEEKDRVEKREVRLSSDRSTVLSWMYHGSDWSASVSYFNQDRNRVKEPYERFQLNISKPFVIAGLNAEVSYYIQHNRQPKSALVFKNQIYSTPNVYYGQLAIEF